MKKAKKLLLLLTMILSLITPASVPMLGTLETASAAVKLNYKQLTLNKGQSIRMNISGTARTAKWSSSDKFVASVSKKGVVTAKQKGTAVITAKILNKKYTCKVTVKKYKNVSKKSIRIDTGKAVSLRVKANWKSSDHRIAKVSKKGVIQAIRPGMCEISAAVNGHYYIYVIKAVGPVFATTTPIPIPTIITTFTPAPIVTNTPVPTPVITNSPTPTPIWGVTSTPIPATPTPIWVVTSTPTPTPIWVVTNTPIPTVIDTPTPKPVVTNTPTPTPTITNTPIPVQPQSYVWLPATGKMYHEIPNCGNMDPTRATRVTLEEAIRRGYPPCDKCF